MRRIVCFLFAIMSLSSSCEKMEVNNDAVDLGLSVKWAKCNLGARSPEWYGDFYAWGETVSKIYFVGNYKFLRERSTPYYLTKYCNNPEHGQVDNLMSLEKCDDAASVQLGGKWRIPTQKEWEELIEKCDWTWTDGYSNDSWIPGFIITSKVPGYENSSLFLPVIGFMSDAHYEDREKGYYLT